MLRAVPLPVNVRFAVSQPGLPWGSPLQNSPDSGHGCNRETASQQGQSGGLMCSHLPVGKRSRMKIWNPVVEIVKLFLLLCGGDRKRCPSPLLQEICFSYQSLLFSGPEATHCFPPPPPFPIRLVFPDEGGKVPWRASSTVFGSLLSPLTL